jgi:hypothetical protein
VEEPVRRAHAVGGPAAGDHAVSSWTWTRDAR